MQLQQNLERVFEGKLGSIGISAFESHDIPDSVGITTLVQSKGPFMQNLGEYIERHAPASPEAVL